MNPITPIDPRMKPIEQIMPQALSRAGVSESGSDFQEILVEQIEKISELHARADNLVKSLAMGGDVDLHEVVIAVEKADLALMFAVQLRNKVLESYQEITRMQI